MSTLWGWAAAIAIGCAPAPSDDAFRNRLARECANEEGCRTLTQEAETRAQRCRAQAECTQARNEHAAANARLNERVRERTAKEARAEAERSARSKESQTTLDRELTEHAKKREQQREERERLRQEAKEREAAHLRFLGAEGRRRELVACYDQHAPIGCTETVAQLLAATSDAKERRSLIALNEKTMQRHFDTARAPSVGQILCCDGTSSKTCGCGGKLKNCCPRQVGVCGCVAAPTPDAQGTGE